MGVVSGSAKPQDISFYFVHWFVDLAGAEPYPLEGCEKFVLKFPVKVLRQFLESFSIVAQLSWGSSETEVFEEYVKWRWSSHEPETARRSSMPSVASLHQTKMCSARRWQSL